MYRDIMNFFFRNFLSFKDNDQMNVVRLVVIKLF